MLTVGGTPLDAIQRYGPIWRRVTRIISSSGPSILATATVYTDAGIYKFRVCINVAYSALLYTLRSSPGESFP